MNKILVTQSSMASFDEYTNEIKDIWDNKWFTNDGIKHQKLEKEISNYLNVENVSLFCNGHLALHTAIKVLNLKGEIITTPFTFASTTHAIVENGLTPVFCDIKESDYTIDPDKIEELITDKTSAILPVHVYGNICDVEKIEEIAKKHNLKVIYDAAHAFGVKKNNESISKYGDISMFSFHSTKVYNTIEGGAIVCNENLKMQADKLKNFGINKKNQLYEEIGYNAKMNEFQAAMGICNLRHLDEEIGKRKELFELYIDCLSNIQGIKIPCIPNDIKHNYSYFPVVFEENFGKSRDYVEKILNDNNIYPRKYFYPIIQDYECYKKDYDSSKTPIAKRIADQVLTLPLYADLKKDDVKRICKIIKDCRY